MLNAGKNLGATLTSFLLGVRDPCRVSSLLGDSGTPVGRDLDRGSVGAVFARGRNTSADGDRAVGGTSVIEGLGGGNPASVNDRALGGSSASRW